MGCLSWGGHNQDFRAREHTCKTHLDVACPRRHVDHEVVDVAPGDLFQEVLDRPVEHQGTPHDRLVLAGQETHRHDPQLSPAEAPHEGLDQLAPWLVGVETGLQLAGHAEHPRHGEACDVSVEHPDGEAPHGEAGGQVDRYRRLAYSTFARRNGDDPCPGRHRGLRRALPRFPASPRHNSGLLLPVHLARLDLDGSHARQGADAPCHLCFDLAPERARRRCERHSDHDHPVRLQLDTVDHFELDDIVTELGVHHATERIAHGCLGELGERFHDNMVRPFGTTERLQLPNSERACTMVLNAKVLQGGLVSTTSTESSIGTLALSDAAAAKVTELLEEEGNPELFLRVAVRPGGCSGFSYEMFFDTELAEDDVQSGSGGVKVVVDPASATLIAGATLEYKDGLQGAGFSINNPNATRTCGCGQSFS